MEELLSPPKEKKLPQPEEKLLRTPTFWEKYSKFLWLILPLLLILILIPFLVFTNKKPKPTQPPQLLTPTQSLSLPTPTADPTANWKTYRNEKYGFELKYPNDFDLDEPAQIGSGLEYPDIRYYHSLDLRSFIIENNKRDWDSVFILVTVHNNGFELLPLGTDLTNAKEVEGIEEALQRAYSGKEGIVTYKKIGNREESGRVERGSLFYYALFKGINFNYSIGIHLPYSLRDDSNDVEIRKFINNYNQLLSTFKFLSSTTLVPADSKTPAAGVCSKPSTDRLITVTVYQDNVPSPRCVKATSTQMLKIVNNSLVPININVGQYNTTIQVGNLYEFPVQLGAFLAPGVHNIVGEIWLQ